MHFKWRFRPYGNYSLFNSLRKVSDYFVNHNPFDPNYDRNMYLNAIQITTP